MKRFLLKTIVVSCFIGVVSCSSNDVTNDPKSKLETNLSLYKEVPAQEAAIYYENLINSFKQPTKSSISTTNYPDFYGGGYIDDNGKLVIYINEKVNKSSNLKSDIAIRAGSQDIKYKSAKYSYNLLNSIMDKIDNYKLNNNNVIANNFNTYYLSDKDNAVIVELNEYSNNKIEEFKNAVINSPAIIFEESSGELIDQATNICGSETTSN